MHPTLSPQVKVQKVQANVESQMPVVTSDSQKRRGQVAFLSVRLVHPQLQPRLRGPLRAWREWGEARRTETECLSRRQRRYWLGAQRCLSIRPSTPQKLIQTAQDEVNACFSEVIQEVKQMQMKVLDFMEKEEAAALGKLGGSIQQSHNRLLKLEGGQHLAPHPACQPEPPAISAGKAPPYPHLCPTPITTSTRPQWLCL